ncbi:hypothetical protein FB45DRAFT_912598 [Roridomyces roridus]|uniref:Hamartin n=1 Tax=Roridomyces roridus TaxID=1738132 RepID=A0AAD7FQF4_9AGAR|nr:hypothetical protein FB45DRAFT_912598 [Roridomyces roridus]
MPVTLARQVRSVLETENGSLTDLLSYVDDFVQSAPSDQQQGFEEQLHQLHDVVDHSSPHHTQVFLAVLHHLRLAPCSIISSWFDLVIRPALREPNLAVPAVNYAKELVLSALCQSDPRVPDFRRRLLDLYLLDAFNEGSGHDLVEWAALDSLRREQQTRWKLNLQDILLTFGEKCPADFLTEVNTHFAVPEARLQLLLLLNLYTSAPCFQPSSAILATHPLMDSLLNSLLLDKSSTLSTIGLAIVTKMLPIFAVEAAEVLKGMLPRLFCIHARIICWKEQPPPTTVQSPETEGVPVLEQESHETGRVLLSRSDLDWQVLESPLDTDASPPPSPRQFHTLLYYLFPCNVLRFLRHPVLYFTSRNVESPYTVDWDVALDEQKIRSKSEVLLRSHVCHPLIVWRDSDEEISKPDFWAEYSVARIATEAMMLDVRNTALGLRERFPTRIDHESSTSSIGGSDDGGKTPMRSLGLSAGQTHISLQDMIATSVALKSNLNLEIEPAASQWPESLFAGSGGSPAVPTQPLPSSDGDLPPRITQAISGLQREVLLLRSELNFELWLSRENVKHVGRLYQDQILSRDAEVERQGLYNKLRNYRSQVANLETELRTQKASASSSKERYADWNAELQKKLQDFREQKKSWVNELAALRTADKEAKALFKAQATLLADAQKDLFMLETQRTESQHKIDRLQDYEKQIEQHVNMQRLWDADFAKFTQRGEEMERMKAEYREMELRLQSFEGTQMQMDQDARVHRRQIQTLEAQLAQEKRRIESPSQRQAEIAAFAAERKRLAEENALLVEENRNLREDLEDTTAMVEVLKGTVGGRRGVVSEPRASPILRV